MTQEFEFTREDRLPATPEQIWEAIATGPGRRAWMFPMEIEPRLGGTVSRGPAVVTAWDPPRRLALRCERDDGFTSAADHRVNEGDGDNSVLRSTHNWFYAGELDAGWEAKTDAAIEFTNLYFHTLGQYLRHFEGRAATYVSAHGPGASSEAKAFTLLRQGLGLDDDASQGDAVQLAVPGLGPLDAVVDYQADTFLGLRTAEGLYRFLGGEKWAWPISVGHHLFSEGIDEEQAGEAWRAWLAAMFA